MNGTDFKFTVNGQNFTINDFAVSPTSPLYATYWNQSMLIKFSFNEPEDFNPDSISEEWKKLETPEDFAWFCENIPNRGGYAPSNWDYNKARIVEHATEVDYTEGWEAENNA